MKISFLSMDQEQNKTYFVSDAVVNQNTYIFADNSTEDVFIHLTIEKEDVYINRQGEIKMSMHFREGMILPASYKNSLGLEFEFEILCTKLTILDKKILIWYDMLIKDCATSSFKIAINILK